MSNFMKRLGVNFGFFLALLSRKENTIQISLISKTNVGQLTTIPIK